MADTPHLTVRSEYPDTDMSPTEVTFRLSPSYGLTTGHEANEWFIDMLRDHELFEVETDRAGEPPLSFLSETVRGVMVEEGQNPRTPLGRSVHPARRQDEKGRPPKEPPLFAPKLGVIQCP